MDLDRHLSDVFHSLDQLKRRNQDLVNPLPQSDDFSRCVRLKLGLAQLLQPPTNRDKIIPILKAIQNGSSQGCVGAV